MMTTQDVSEIHTNSVEIELKLKEKCINSDVEVIPIFVEDLNSDKVTKAKEHKHLEVDIVEKENKKHRKLKTKLKRRSPDPAVINISELMSSSLRIISPDKSGIPTMLSDLDDVASNEGLGLIVEKELNKSFDCDLNKLNSSIEEEIGNTLNLRKTRKKRSKLSLKDSPQSIKDEDTSQRNLNNFLQINLQKERTDSNVTISTNSSSSDGKSKKSNQKEKENKETKRSSLRKSVENDVSSEIDNSLEKSCEEILEDLSAFADNENSSKDKSSEDSLKQPSPKENVFNFMMHQRNKSIGMNYDGKPIEESPNNENSEINLDCKKNALAKRKGKFEEWNNKKGLKRKQIEEEREEYCHAVLDHRSKKLKKMLSITPKKNGVKRKRVRRLLSSESNSDASSDIISPPNSKKPKDCLTLIEDTLDVEVFKKHTHTDSRTNKVQKGLLSFFGVLDTKKAQSENTVVMCDEPKNDSQQSSIKVKMFSPKVSRKRNVLNIDESSTDQISNENTNKLEEKRERMPRKAKLATKVAVIEESNDENSNCSIYSESESNHSVKARKPRKTKKDIFSVEKMKAVIKLKMENNLHIDLTESPPERRSSGRVKVTKNYNEDEDNSSTEQKKNMKVAPIFNVKPKVDPKVLEARMNFLRSGIPEKIKKQIEKPPEIEFDIFPKISHVLQNDSSDLWDTIQVTMKFQETKSDLDLNFDNFKFESITNSKNAKQKIINLNAPNRNNAFKKSVQEIKEANPEYPVNKFFRILHEKSGYNVAKEVVNAVVSPPKVRKRGRPKKKVVEEKPVETKTSITLTYDDRMWTEKYKAKCSDDIIGNQKSLKALKSWLDNWIQFTEEVGKTKKTYRRDSSDFETTDNESRDGGMPGNGMILRGPTSSGKTSSLYAICNELNINVIELNASSKRTGKRLLQELQEATQSHQVRKKDNNPLSSFLNKKKVSAADKVESSRKMCILLVEDVDIVFDQDEGFVNALSQLFSTSKRPIVLTMSDVDCSHLHKFTSQYPVLKFNPLSARSLGVWLQILCLVEGLKVDLGSLSELLEWNKGDIRRTLMQLQFWGQTGGDCSNSRSNAVSYIRNCNELEKLNKSDDYLDDDTNEVSFLQDDEAATVNTERVHKNCIGTFLVHEIDEFSLPYPIDLGNVWWNLPTILHFNPINHNIEASDKPEVKEDLEKLESIANVFDAMSVADAVLRTDHDDYDLEPCVKRWNSPLKTSLNFKENMDSYRGSFKTDLTHHLVEGYCKLHKSDEAEAGISMAAPSLEELRWRQRRHDCENVFLEATPLSNWTDRAAFSTDYFPVLRQISRSEIVRSDNSNKRGNRFYNYLRTLNINPSNSNIKTACDMFQ